MVEENARNVLYQIKKNREPIEGSAIYLRSSLCKSVKDKFVHCKSLGKTSITDLLNEVFQSSVWQTGVLSLYSCGGIQHCPFLILSMPSGEEMTASFSLHTPLRYLPSEQFTHPGRLRANSQLIS